MSEQELLLPGRQVFTKGSREPNQRAFTPPAAVPNPLR